jgi:hypothetical protein
VEREDKRHDSSGYFRCTRNFSAISAALLCNLCDLRFPSKAKAPAERSPRNSAENAKKFTGFQVGFIEERMCYLAHLQLPVCGIHLWEHYLEKLSALTV